MAEAATQLKLKLQAPPSVLEREPLVANQRPIGWVSDTIAGVAEGKTPLWWWIAFSVSFPLMLFCFGLIERVFLLFFKCSFPEKIFN